MDVIIFSFTYLPLAKADKSFLISAMKVHKKNTMENKELAHLSTLRKKAEEQLIMHSPDADLSVFDVMKLNHQLQIYQIELEMQNDELKILNIEKEKSEAILIIANAELVFQNLEKGKRAAELIIANKELK